MPIRGVTKTNLYAICPVCGKEVLREGKKTVFIKTHSGTKLWIHETCISHGKRSEKE